MSLFSIPGLYENERPCLALWSIGHGPSYSSARIVFPGLKSDFLLRHVTRGGGDPWETRETALPGPTYAGIIERLELISIPLVATPQGGMCDGATCGFWYGGYDQAISASWYYPPEEWKPLAEWHGETCRILSKSGQVPYDQP